MRPAGRLEEAGTVKKISDRMEESAETEKMLYKEGKIRKLQQIHL